VVRRSGARADAHMQELPVHARSHVAELGHDRVLGHVDGHLGREDGAAALQQRPIRRARPRVVHFFHHHEQQRERQVKALRDVLACQREQLARVKALEDRACARARRVQPAPEGRRGHDGQNPIRGQ